MFSSSPYWPATSPTSTSSSTLLDDAAYPPHDNLLCTDELPGLVAGKITQPVIDYLVDCVCDAVDFGLNRTSASSKQSKSRSRRSHSDKVRTDRATFAEFVATVLRRAEVTLSTVIGALVYIDRARPHLSIAIEEWAQHRVLLGSLIVASKYLNDASLKNAHWALCTGVFGRRDVQRIEREFLDVLAWELGVSEIDLMRICSRMVTAGVFIRQNVKPAEPISPAKDAQMEVDELKRKPVGNLRSVRALWHEKARRQVLALAQHRPEKRAQADVEMDVDNFEERARRRRSAYPSPASSDSSCTASSSPETDSDNSVSPCTPPQLHQVSHEHYSAPGGAAKSQPHPMHAKSASNGSMTYQPLLDAFPAVPQSSQPPMPTPALQLSPVRVPTAPPPLPSLPPYSSYPFLRAFAASHPHLRPSTAQPASPYGTFSLHTGSGKTSNPRPVTPYSHKRTKAFSIETAPPPRSLYPAYIPAAANA